MRIISVISALALTWAGSLSAQDSATDELTNDPIYKEGITALTDNIPTIASKKFSSLLKSKKLTNETKLKLLFLLTESQVRANKPAEALETLSDPLISDQPDAIFWKGQALASAGRYKDAIEMLETAQPQSKNYQLAQIKIATLAAALNDTDKSLSILKKYLTTNKKVAPLTYLSLANLYLTKKDPANAAKMLAKLDNPNNHAAKVKQVIQAQIDILNKNYPAAISSLETLIASSEGISHKTLSFATLYLADALYNSGQTEDAIRTLIDYLDKNPTPLLSTMFARLGKWIPADAPITDPVIKKLNRWSEREHKTSTDQPSQTEEHLLDLSAFAQYYYARHLAASNDPASKTNALAEFELLRTRYPASILAGTSLTDTATTLLALGDIEAAKNKLKAIQNLETPIAPIAKQQASFLLGKLQLDQKNYLAAAKSYQAVVDSASGELRSAAIVNAASSFLEAEDTQGFNHLQQNIQDPVIRKNLTLEYALWQARENQLEARNILHEFILKNPHHPRIIEAQLSLARHCLRVPPVDQPLCQLTISQIHADQIPHDQQADYHYLLYRNAIATENYPAAVDATSSFLKSHPESPRKVEFTLLLGLALYHNGQHNDAHLLLLKMVESHPDDPLKDYAEYYAAMAAKQEGTPQSQEKAITLFTTLQASKSHLAPEALLQLSQLYLDKNQPQEAIKVLKPYFDNDPKGKKSLPLGTLLATAYQKLDQTKPENAQAALDIYDNLIKQNKDNPQALNELKYQKALALQHMDLDDQALELYYSVINIDSTVTPITEWKWYYKCGFTAIAMLEEMKNPTAALAVAKKLAASKGSRAKEAATRARLIEMKYMIWQN